MDIKSLLNYSLVQIGERAISPYTILMVLLIVGATKFVLNVTRKVLNRKTVSKRLDKAKTRTVFQIMRYLLWVIAISLALDTLGIKMTFLITSSAALLVGVGLGLQHTFNDIISGIILLFEGSLQVDNIVEVSDTVGKVEEIGIRTTRIVTMDNIKIIIPNSKFIQENVINWSHIEEKTRFVIGIGVAYGSDVERVKLVLEQIAASHPKVCSNPIPTVMFKDFGDSSLDFELFFWIDSPFEFYKVKSDLRFAVDKQFRLNNITIPFPQRDIHFFPNNETG